MISRIINFLLESDQWRAPFYVPLQNNGRLRFSIEVSLPDGFVVVYVSSFVASPREITENVGMNLI